MNKLGFGRKGYYSIYLVVGQNRFWSPDGMFSDYHFYRQDKGGGWSHKPGTTKVSTVDASGKRIKNIYKANYGNYKDGGILLWVKKWR